MATPNLNPYRVGVVEFTVVALYVIIIGYLLRVGASYLAASNNNVLANLGAAIGALF